MTWPTIFANLAAGNQPLSLFDTMFNQVAAMIGIPCTASGTNAITLTPIGSAPTLAAYQDYNIFSFVAANSSTGAVTLALSGLSSLAVYRRDGTTQITTGEIVSGRMYWVQYRAALAAGAGGFYLLEATYSPAAASAANQQTFNASGTWTKPGSGTVALIQCWGAGGSGGRAGAADGGGGGGGGAYVERFIVLSSLGATETVTVGTGGASQTSDNSNGAAGGNTTFGAFVTAFGGGGGAGAATQNGGGGGGGMKGAGASSTTAAGAAGGLPSGANPTGASNPALLINGNSVAAWFGLGSTDAATPIPGGANIAGGAGGGAGGNATTGAPGGWSYYGGGGGGGGNELAGAGVAIGGDSICGGAGGGGGSSTTSASAGGTSLWGGNGGAGGFDNNAAVAGSQPGGGGGGSETGNSGAGADGKCVVTVW